MTTVHAHVWELRLFLHTIVIRLEHRVTKARGMRVHSSRITPVACTLRAIDFVQ